MKLQYIDVSRETSIIRVNEQYLIIVYDKKAI